MTFSISASGWETSSTSGGGATATLTLTDTPSIDDLIVIITHGSNGAAINISSVTCTDELDLTVHVDERFANTNHLCGIASVDVTVASAKTLVVTWDSIPGDAQFEGAVFSAPGDISFDIGAAEAVATNFATSLDVFALNGLVVAEGASTNGSFFQGPGYTLIRQIAPSWWGCLEYNLDAGTEDPVIVDWNTTAGVNLWSSIWIEQAAPSGFEPAWANRSSHLIGGGALQ